MAGGGKDKLEYVKQQEPKFLRDFKARSKFKEGPTIESKRQNLANREGKHNESDEERDEKEDEKPVICVLKEGDLTEEDYENYCKTKSESDGSEPAGSKIVFKRPVKRKSEDSQEKIKSPSKNNNDKEEKNKKKSKKVENKSLLSFDEDDE